MGRLEGRKLALLMRINRINNQKTEIMDKLLYNERY